MVEFQDTTQPINLPPRATQPTGRSALDYRRPFRDCKCNTSPALNFKEAFKEPIGAEWSIPAEVVARVLGEIIRTS